MVEAIYKKGDYIINRDAGDIGIVKGVTKKNYYQFSQYYGGMFEKLKELDKYPYELQVNYQKFFDLCNDDEKRKMDSIVKEACQTK